jgi:hypothetical protein
MNKTLVGAVLALATLSSGVAGAQPSPGPRGYEQGPGRGGCFPGEPRDNCRERQRVEQRSHRRYEWRDGRYQEQGSNGAAVAGGIIGFILGAAIAGSNSDRDYYVAHRSDRGWRNRCSKAHRGFDARTGTYLGPDGYRHYCVR